MLRIFAEVANNPTGALRGKREIRVLAPQGKIVVD
jgi:hypothetical protein